ncbi:phospholipase [Actinocorallia herbida]|uniref:phospholipase n=1 Tax=Actinocorallia herbida TaxID=58109 RepID=UPI00147707F6|nr:phospholipase [Actinocorallia herbida]
MRKVSPGLEEVVWELTSGNKLDSTEDDPASWISQVPDVWGWSKDKPVPKGADKPGIKALLAKIRAAVAGAGRSVDVSGFGPPNVFGSPSEPFPDGVFHAEIVAGLKVAARAAAVAERRLKVRILTGVPGFDVTASPWAYRDKLKRDIGADAKVIDFTIASMTTRGISSYNHTKFLIVDGVFVLHGGINWMANFYVEDGTYGSRGFGGGAPVTDVDIALRGPAALSAGKFLDRLWKWTCENATLEGEAGYGAWLSTNGDRIEEAAQSLYEGVEAEKPGTLQVLSVGSLGYGIEKKDTKSSYEAPPARAIEAAACYYRLLTARKQNNETNTDRDFMTVNPDANALRALVAAAKKKIVLSQQDINGFAAFPLYHALYDVRFLDVLAAKMTADTPVKVRIVISNPGAPDYSNIPDLRYPVAALLSRVALKTGSMDHAHRVLSAHLQLAPLRVGDEATWPGGYKYRLHTKIVLVDDTAFYVGSRNVYPDTTQDHGFIIEDAAAAKQLCTAFLDKQWLYSKKAAVYD